VLKSCALLEETTVKLHIILGLSILIAAPAGTYAEMPSDLPRFQKARQIMVDEQIRARGISDPNVLHAMEHVPRHFFVPQKLHRQAYADHPLPIGEGQTISQPYIVALMTESLMIKGFENVLEIGTGSGYQAAVLAEIARSVTTIEIKEKLFDKASRLLGHLNYSNITTVFGDGYHGWKTKAPYDCIIITAAVDHIPPPLRQQLKDGGRLILPLGNPFSYQNLVLVTKKGNDFLVRQITGVLFVPLTGHAMKIREE
jgi:protein-L-isoaspartate(D-aspartate) O-methyltransferase